MHPWVGPEYSFAVSEAGKPKAVTCRLAPLSLLTLSNSHTCVICVFTNTSTIIFANHCKLPARALVTFNSIKFSHLRQLPNLYFAYTFMAKTNTETNTSRGINRCVTSSKSSNTFGNSCYFALSVKTRLSILCVTHQMSRKKRNYSVGGTLPYEMMKCKWYLVVLCQHMTILAGTWSV